MDNMIIPTEDSEQAALFEWAAYNEGKYPELRMLYAIPNGGKRHIKTAMTMKRTGVKKGVPDICLPVPRGGYAALYIELKRTKGGRTSTDQKIWMNKLQELGNCALVCKGWQEASDVLIKYLEGKL